MRTREESDQVERTVPRLWGLERYLFYLYVVIAPSLFFRASSTFLDPTAEELLRFTISVVFAAKLFLGDGRFVWPRLGLGRFLIYVFVLTSIAAPVAVWFYDAARLDLQLISQPVPRAVYQIGNIISWLPLFYYGYWVCIEESERLRRWLLATVSAYALVAAGQIVIYEMTGWTWGVTSVRGPATIRVGSSTLLRAYGVAGEPKHLASLMLIGVVPFVFGTSRSRNPWDWLAGTSCTLALLWTFSASGYAAAAAGLGSMFLMTMYVLGSKHRSLPFARWLGPILVVVVGMLLMENRSPVLGEAVNHQFARLGSLYGSMEVSPYLAPVFIDLPGLGPVPFDATDASPLKFLLENPWAFLTGVGDGMISIFSRQVFTGHSGWLGAGYGGVIDPSIGAIKMLADWGLIGMVLFAWFVYRVLRNIRYAVRRSGHVQDGLFWTGVVIAVAVSLADIAHGLSNPALLGAAAGWARTKGVGASGSSAPFSRPSRWIGS